MTEGKRTKSRPSAIAMSLCGLALLAACQGSGGAASVGIAGTECEKGPVLMIISGTTLDVDRMATYSEAIEAAGLYPLTGGYYLNAPRPLKVFEGEVPKDFVTLVVRFPSMCAAEKFWYSDEYQYSIKPLRENPPAGDYTVAVFPEAKVPDYMSGRVIEPEYFPRKR